MLKKDKGVFSKLQRQFGLGTGCSFCSVFNAHAHDCWQRAGDVLLVGGSIVLGPWHPSVYTATLLNIFAAYAKMISAIGGFLNLQIAPILFECIVGIRCLATYCWHLYS